MIAELAGNKASGHGLDECDDCVILIVGFKSLIGGTGGEEDREARIERTHLGCENIAATVRQTDQ
jgi:hypothetical protein